MAKPKVTPINCSVCGRVMGSKAGVQVVLGAVCDNPICNFQDPAPPNSARDAVIVAGAMANVPVAQIAYASNMSRQRVYQIVTAWKQGV